MKKLFNKLFGGKTERDTDDVDGGVKKHIDRNAPKIIESTNLTDFSCKFSLTSYFHDGAKDGFDGLFNLSASLSEGKVTGKYVHTRTRAEHVSASFTAGEEFLAELEKINAENNNALVGQDFELLAEGPSKRNSASWMGKTDTFKQVFFKAPEGLKKGDFINVHIVRATSMSLYGDVI